MKNKDQILLEEAYELICENAPLINKDDIIIIGWSELTRFRLSGRDSEWCHLISNFQNNFSELPNVSENTLNEIFVNRSLKLYVDEYMKRRNKKLSESQRVGELESDIEMIKNDLETIKNLKYDGDE